MIATTVVPVAVASAMIVARGPVAVASVDRDDRGPRAVDSAIVMIVVRVVGLP